MSLKIQDKKSYLEVNKNKLKLQKRKEIQRNTNGRKGKVGMTGVVHN